MGVKGGTEIAVKPVLEVINQLGDIQNQEYVMLKIDFKNAFNMVDRSEFLSKVRILFPKMYNWVHLMYAQNSFLVFGDKIILSSCGVQQGDPLGPLLFALVLHEIPLQIEDDDSIDLILQTFFLNDGTFVGKADDVLKVLEIIQNVGSKMGLFLNLSKCELFWPSGISQSVLDKFPGEIEVCKEEGTELLGAPISLSENFVQNFMVEKVNKVKKLHGKLTQLRDSQMSYLLLKSCLNWVIF